MTPFRTLAPAALLGALLLASPARAGGPQAGLIEAKMASVVSLKLTIKVTGSYGSQSMDREFNRTIGGVLVDPAGLVMVPSMYVSAPKQEGADFKVTPTSIRVIFPGDEKEYEAILGAVDTKYNLAYILIRDLSEKKIQSVDFAKASEPQIGDQLFAVRRLGQGYDYAPTCVSTTISGKVTKPREMWCLDGMASEAAQPLYTADGAVAGIMIMQEGVGEGGGRSVFLLPLKLAQASIERSLKAAQKELENVKTREAEAAAKAKEAAAEKPGEKPAEKPPTPEKPPEKPPTPEKPPEPPAQPGVK